MAVKDILVPKNNIQLNWSLITNIIKEGVDVLSISALVPIFFIYVFVVFMTIIKASEENAALYICLIYVSIYIWYSIKI